MPKIIKSLKEQVVSTENKYLEVLEYLAKQDSIAVDLEFDKNRYRYGFTMCLMQVAVGSDCFVLDPLSDGIDISRTFHLMENPKIQKLTFEFGEDIRLFHHLGCKPKNIYDLSVATKLLDYSQVSLGNILSQFLNIDADKSSQKSNWFQRPLTEKQLQYAADDVRYLHQLESLLNNKIIHKKMMSWVQEEREFFESQDFENTENSNYFKPRDKDGMSEVQWFIFEKLIAYREKLAEGANKPSYQILDKDYLLSLAKSKNEIQSFYAESRAPKKLMNESFKNQLLEVLNKSKIEAIQLGLSLDKLVNPMLSKEEMSLVRSTKKERDSIVANIYKPIQSLIKRDFGENAAVYIMGNKLMTELASGSYLNLRAYKRELISKYADELNLKIELN